MTLQNTVISPDFSVNKTSICITIEKWSMYGDARYIAESNVNDSLIKNYIITFLCDALKGADNAFLCSIKCAAESLSNKDAKYPFTNEYIICIENECGEDPSSRSDSKLLS